MALDLSGLAASCEGDYAWSYRTGIGKVRGDGRVHAKIGDTKLELRIRVGVDALGAPSRISLKRCDVSLNAIDAASSLFVVATGTPGR